MADEQCQDCIDKIVLSQLKESYNTAAYFEDTKAQKHLRKVIKYYSTASDYKDWKESLNESS